MSGFLLFVVFLGLILVGGYLKAKKEANSTPLKRSLNRAASHWNNADPKHRAMMLASIGVFEHSPSFAVYLASTWAQLGLNMCALLAATFDAIEEAPSAAIPEPARLARRNPALDELKQLPQTAVTEGLIATVPGLATELSGVAAEGARAIGIPDTDFAECIFDLMVIGAIRSAGNFTGDQNQASLFADALIFEATGKCPTEPTVAEIIAGRTHQYRGISKYALASRHLRGRDPIASLFGKEFAQAKGDGANEDDLARGTLLALQIRQTGEWATEMALTGKTPTDEEIQAVPKFLDSLGEAVLPRPNGAIVQAGKSCEETAAQQGSDTAKSALDDLDPLLVIERAKRTIKLSGAHFNFGSGDEATEARKRYYAGLKEAVRVLTEAGYKVKSTGWGYKLEDTQ